MRKRTENMLKQDDVKDENENAIPCEQIEYSIKVKPTGYKLDYCMKCRMNEKHDLFEYGCFIDGSRVGEHKLYGEANKINIK